MTPEKAQGAKKKQGYKSRKDVCKNMSAEEFERFTEEKKISDWVAPKTIYDKEARRREKTATRLSMLRYPITNNSSIIFHLVFLVLHHGSHT